MLLLQSEVTEVKKQQRIVCSQFCSLVLENSSKQDCLEPGDATLFLFRSDFSEKSSFGIFTLILIQVHFSLDYFNNFVVSATVIQIQSISDLYL